MTRILPIVSALVMVGMLAYLFQSGVVGEILRPQTLTVVAKADVASGEAVTVERIELRPVRTAELPAGALFLPREAEVGDVMAALGRAVFRSSLRKGEIVLWTHLQEPRTLVGLRAMREMSPGDPLGAETVSTYAVRFDPVAAAYDIEPGSLVFPSTAAARQFLGSRPDMRFVRAVEQNRTITGDDVLAADMRRWVLRLDTSLRAGSSIDREMLEPVALDVDGIDDGALVFRSQETALAAASQLTSQRAATDLRREAVLRFDMLEPAPSGERPTMRNPRTLDELEVFARANPAEVIRLDADLLGTEIREEGVPLDIWVETSRTPEGLLGQIVLQRIATHVPLRRVEQVEMIPPAGVASDVEVDVIDFEERHSEHFWLRAPASIGEAMARATAGGHLVLTMHAERDIVEMIGNGAVCSENRCIVNRQASKDLANLLQVLRQVGAVMEGGAGSDRSAGSESLRVGAAGAGASGECRIKGNISNDGARIYHLPGQANYDRVTIDTARGERWFCTSEEARAAGWRRAQN